MQGDFIALHFFVRTILHKTVTARDWLITAGKTDEV